MFKFFKKHEAKIYWMIDDDTCMPIACDSYETAVKVVNEEFNGELNRIYTMVK